LRLQRNGKNVKIVVGLFAPPRYSNNIVIKNTIKDTKYEISID